MNGESPTRDPGIDERAAYRGPIMHSIAAELRLLRMLYPAVCAEVLAEANR